MMRTVHEGTDAFERERARLLGRGSADLAAVETAVREIIAEVRRAGDEAVRQFVERFESRKVEVLFTRDYDGAGAFARLSPEVRAGLETAAARIARYHERQLTSGFRYEEDGIRLGMRERPLARVGVYAPGGKARYPSSVLMAAIPARVAGVADIVLATPAPNDVLLAAAHLAGVTGILDAGGAQAIAALAYGTSTIPKVDKIVGPGNRFVACAKRLVFGDVGIDGITGPSEILVLCDETANARWVAADLLSQAEHDEVAYPLCITTSLERAQEIAAEVETQLASLPRRKIAEASVANQGVILVVRSRPAMAALADAIGPEHLALHVHEPEQLFDAIGAAGAAFVGPDTPEAAGDYLAGPSHVLPTGGAVRYGSPLGVYDFIARTSFIQYTAEALRRQSKDIATLARAEGLEAHARAMEVRMGDATKDTKRGA
ncbi:MAG TPA: histidinol dehydrogenase [Polyangiaceae bacterium]|nr:histidinol dehydrogenase [Polyangiaceae bacterium]